MNSWRTLSNNLKIQSGLKCERCGKIVTNGKQLIGHHKIELTDENVEDVNISLNPDNIEVICLDCHNKEHKRFGNSKQVYLVYGAPLSGKSSLVKTKAGWRDIIVDIDNLCQAVTGLETYTKPNNVRFNVFTLYDTLLDQIKTRYGNWYTAYIVGGFANRYELEMQCPVYGNMFNELKLERIILAKPNDTQQAQPFKIYQITKPINRIVTIYAEHISYMLLNIIAMPFIVYEKQTVNDVFRNLKGYAIGYNPFTFASNITTSMYFYHHTPDYFKNVLQGKEGSVLDKYGGEFNYDRYLVELNAPNKVNNGVVLEYGKNIIDLEQEENNASTITGIVPFWQSEDKLTLVELGGTSIGDSKKKLELVDLSSEFENAPTKQQLNDKGYEYWYKKAKRTPDVSIKVSFIPLWQTENYRDDPLFEVYKTLEQVALGDLVKVEFKEMGISASAKVMKYEYDVLKERYTSIEIGRTKANIASSLAAMDIQLRNQKLIK